MISSTAVRLRSFIENESYCVQMDLRALVEVNSFHLIAMTI